jgi:hypothetical protein
LFEKWKRQVRAKPKQQQNTVAGWLDYTGSIISHDDDKTTSTGTDTTTTNPATTTYSHDHDEPLR